jgi:predicted permease
MISFMTSRWRDALSYRRRYLRYTCAIILFLSVGIGLMATFYAAADAALVKPFPYDRDNSLLMLYQAMAPGSGLYMDSEPDLIDLRRQSQVLQGLAAYQEQDKSIMTAGEPSHLAGIAVDRFFFPLLRVAPELGRAFGSGDEAVGAPDVVILSHGFWERQFGGSRDVLGSSILLNQKPYTVIGIMPADFNFVSEMTVAEDIWLPLRAGTFHRGDHDKSAIARLKDGVTPAQATAELRLISRRIAAQYPDERSYYFLTKSFRDSVLGQLQSIAWVLGILAGGMLLMVCVNVAGLCLVEAQAARSEVELRTALGGTRWQIARPFVQRALLRAALGASGGVALAALLLRVMRHLLPAGLPGVETLQVNAPLLGIAAALAAVCALFFGIWPAWAVTGRLQRIQPSGDRVGAERTGIAAQLWRSRTTLVVLQTAFSALFLTVAVLLAVNLWKLLSVDPGYAQTHRIVLTMKPASKQSQGDADAAARYYAGLEAKLAAYPGILGVAIATDPPLGWTGSHSFQIRYQPVPRDPQKWSAQVNAISDNYLSLMHIPVVAGRSLTPDDRPGSEPVALVNQAFARHFFPGESALHHYLSTGETIGGKTEWRQIVGVVHDVRDDRLASAPAPEYYTPWAQSADFAATPSFLLQSALPPDQMLPGLQRVAHSAAPQDLILGPETMGSRRARQLAFPRYRSDFAGATAALALFFSITGLYGLITASLLQRRREMGVRLAVGATYRDIYRIFLRRTLKWTLPATLLGMLGAAGLISGLGAEIGGVSAQNAPAYAGAMLAMLAAAALATVLPVRSALRTDIMASLRSE